MNLADAASSPAESPTKTPAHTPATSTPAQLTPAQRREIEIWFAQALDLSSERRREYAKADELFRKCLTLDGSNVLVVTAYLENLARWRGRKPKSTWSGWWSRRTLFKTKDVHAPERYAVAIKVLSQEPDQSVLDLLAKTCRELHWDLAEEAYLREMLLRDAGQVEVHARLAEICVSRADFACAGGHFEFAKKSLPLLEVEACLQAVREEDATATARDVSSADALDSARTLTEAKQFTAAERLLARAQAAYGNSLALREAREDLQIAQLLHQVAALAEPERKQNALASQARLSLRQKLARLQLDIAGTRADRFPDDWSLRLELVEQLIRVGNFFEALRRLNDRPAPQGVFSARALRLKAETQQRLKRFDAAMNLYRELLAAPAFGELPLEEQQRVRAQAQRLSAAMGPAKTDK